MKNHRLFHPFLWAWVMFNLTITHVQAQGFFSFSNSADKVNLQQAREMLENKQAIVFDIREAEEHANGVAKGMILLPMSTLKDRAHEIPQNPNQPVLLICNTQNRSQRAAQALKKAGWTNVRYVDKGMDGWVKNQWPIVKPLCAMNAQRKMVCS